MKPEHVSTSPFSSADITLLIIGFGFIAIAIAGGQIDFSFIKVKRKLNNPARFFLA
jgi:hypothetical protein